jgi:hypothetical protein
MLMHLKLHSAFGFSLLANGLHFVNSNRKLLLYLTSFINMEYAPKFLRQFISGAVPSLVPFTMNVVSQSTVDNLIEK